MPHSQSSIEPSRLTSCAAEEAFALYQGQIVSRGRLWSDVRQMAAQLPDLPYVFNLCENRYLFAVCLLAAAARGQTCLLPPNAQPAVIEEIHREFPGAYWAAEQVPPASSLPHFQVTVPVNGGSAAVPEFDWPRTAVIAFTSGSTGRPKPCPHSLQTFRVSAEMAVASLGLTEQRWLMLSTSPPQHMYGLETSVFWPLFSRLILHDGRPFFAEDIRGAVAVAPWPSLLASTPTHLRSLLAAVGDWSRLAGILSATDHLSAKLAGEIEAVLRQSPREIYGSTETLSFASRETLREQSWQPYVGCRLRQDPSGQSYLESPHLPLAALLHDDIELEHDGRFTLSGRHGDMVKIGGKRASLSELNRRLLDIDGVDDGFCFVQDSGRLAAVVVSRLAKQAIRAGLQPYLDEVFLPRKIHFITAIPRNATGKLAQAEIDKLLASLV